MRNRYLHLFIVCMMAAACSEEKKRSEINNPISINTKAVQQMDLLEKMFRNDNWMLINSDTTYLNFSRSGNITKVYRYKMIKGDSVNVDLAEIKSSNDTLVWHYDDTTMLYLNAINNNKAEWKFIGRKADAGTLTFEKNADNKIMLTTRAHKYALVKTLPLSSFLIRSHYDFLHGTRYAFSDTVFQPQSSKHK